MSGDLVSVILLACLAALYPTLLAAVTVMLFMPNPKGVMFAYLLGAYTTSITLGLVIVLSLNGSSAVSTARNSLSPAADLAFGAILLLVSFVLASERDAAVRRRRAGRKERNGATSEGREPLSQRLLGQ